MFNWFTEGISVNVVTMLITPIGTVLWTLWKRIKATRKARKPNNKWTTIWQGSVDAVLLTVNVLVFIYLPHVTSRWGALILAMAALGALLSLGSLAWRFLAMRKW